MGLAWVWQRTAGGCLEQRLLQHRHGSGVGLGEDADLWVGGWAGEPVREGELVREGEKSGVERDRDGTRWRAGTEAAGRRGGRGA